MERWSLYYMHKNLSDDHCPVQAEGEPSREPGDARDQEEGGGVRPW